MALSYKNDPEEDERLNPATRANDLYKQEQDPYDRELSDIENNFDDTADPSQEDENIEKSKNIDKARQEEERPVESFEYSPSADQNKKQLTLKGVVKKGGPLGIIGAVLLGGGGLGIFFSVPGLLIVQVKETFTNYNSSASRAAPARYNKMLKLMIGSQETKIACAEKPTGIKCRMGTMSDAQKSNYEAEKFKVKGSLVNGRTVVSSVEFPDGYKATNGNSFISHTKKSIAAASAASKAYNPATKVFNGARFPGNVLKRYGQNKTKEKLNGDTDNERKKSFNTRTGNDISDEDRRNSFMSKYEGRVKGSASQTSSWLGAVSLGCGARNISKAIIAAVKIENGIRFVAFATLFLKAADQIKDKGDIDPETTSMLGGVLTSVALTGPKAGLSATDSQGYKVAAYGNEGALKEFTRAFLLGGNTFLIVLDQTVTKLEELVGGRSNTKALCRSAADWRTALALIAAVCAAQAAGGAVSGTIIPGLGTLAGLAGGAVECAALQILVIIFWAAIIPIIVSWGLPKAIDALANSKLSVDDISGVDAGNAMAVGAGVLLGTTAMSRGLKAGTKSDVTSFLAATSEDKAQADRVAAYDAKGEPFNIYNEYSFLGSSLRKSGITFRAPTSLRQGILQLGTIVRSSFQLIPTASASPASMPVNISVADLSDCPDQEMIEAGVDCDKMGQAQYVLSVAELAMDTGKNIDYMKNGGYIIDDEAGEVDPTTSTGKLYLKWIENCTEHREAPMGSTMTPIEDDGYDWAVGINCNKSGGDNAASEEQLSNFRVYYNSLAEKEDGDYDPTTISTSTDGAKFKVATFNILHVGNDSSEKWHSRLKDTVRVLTSHNIDIAGLQEARPQQQVALKTSEYGGDVYDIWPSKAGDGADPDVNPESVVIWNKEKFELVSARQKKIKYEGNRKVNIVKLKYIENGADGPELYVLNTHDPVDKRADSEGGPKDRKDNNEMYLDTIKNELTDAPVIFTGDFNSKMTVEASGNKPLGGLRENLAYCILTRDSIMWHVSDAQQNKTGQCPSEKDENGGNRVDHIFINTFMKASGYGVAVGGKAVDGSDHDMVYSEVEVPGESAGDISKDGWAWPLPASESKPGPCYGGASVHAGLDINTDGSGHVFAMHDGTVVKVIDGVTGTSPATGNHIMIKTPEGIYYGYQHLLPGKIRVKFGDRVKAGDYIAIAGKTGNVDASSKAHLHITAATTNTTGSYGNLSTTFDPMSVLEDVKPSSYDCY
jgi:endonuclease/exonuclease/phosphatase family metal-dependent hydrolase